MYLECLHCVFLVFQFIKEQSTLEAQYIVFFLMTHAWWMVSYTIAFIDICIFNVHYVQLLNNLPVYKANGNIFRV